MHVREGKDRKERLIPYGELGWCLAIVDRWLEAAAVDTDAVFRGFYKRGRRLRPGRLSVRAIQYILASYPVMVDGRLVQVKPHDCRRLYVAGIDPVAIQQNLGHARLNTTLLYIGTLDADKRQPPLYSFDLGGLAKVPQQGRLGVS